MKKIIIAMFSIIFLTALCFAQNEIISAETYASYYGDAFNGKPTASGEIFDMNSYTAAHKTLPFGTLVEVTNLENGKKVVVRINDRGPFVGNREIDVSKAAALALDMLSRGVTRVSLRKIDPNSKTNLGLQPKNPPSNKGQVPQYPPANQGQVPQYPPVNQGQAPQYPPVNQGQVPQYPPVNQGQVPQYPPVNQGQVPQYPPVNQGQAPQYPPVNQGQAPQYPPVNQGQAPQYQNEAPIYQPVPTQVQTPALVYIPTTPAETPGALWRIQVGSFTREENAMRLVVRLRKIGFEPAFEKTETHVRVVLHGIRPYDLERIKEVLEENDFRDYILRQESW